MKPVFLSSDSLYIIVNYLSIIVLAFAELTDPFLINSISIFSLFLAKFYLKNIDSSGLGRDCLLSLLLTIVATLPFLIFVRFFGCFRLILRSFRFLRLWH